MWTSTRGGSHCHVDACGQRKQGQKPRFFCGHHKWKTLSSSSIHSITKPTTIDKLLCASSSWWGLTLTRLGTSGKLLRRVRLFRTIITKIISTTPSWSPNSICSRSSCCPSSSFGTCIFVALERKEDGFPVLSYFIHGTCNLRQFKHIKPSLWNSLPPSLSSVAF